MALIGSLVVSLVAKTAAFDKGMSKGRKRLRNFKRTVANVERSATAEVVNRVLGLSKTATASDKLTAESKPNRVHSR